MNFDCTKDLIIWEDDGVTVKYQGPRFLRCNRGGCDTLITHKMLEFYNGTCPGRIPGVLCGHRRFKPALNVSPEEQEKLLSGEIMAFGWEMLLIKEEVEVIDCGSYNK